MNDKKIVVARSFSRKISLKNYGGASFETQDFFASYSEEISADSSAEVLKETSRMLYDMARGDVEEAVEETIKGLKSKDPIKLDHEKAIKFANDVATGKKEVYE